MFNYEYSTTVGSTSIILNFIKSLNINAFPCGRRRSTLINYDVDGNGTTGASEGYSIPFDPEARLNTEANNRKHSSLNGYTQTYLKDFDSNSGRLSLSLAGYLFNCDNLDFNNYFANGEVYANIIIKPVELFQDTSTGRSYSEVLGNQTSSDATVLDMCINSGDVTEASNYYFSGLSFSSQSLAELYNTTNNQVNEIRDGVLYDITDTSTKYRYVSLHILEGTSGEWKAYNPAKLPKVAHGGGDNSVVLGDISANTITAPSATVTNLSVATKLTAKGGNSTTPGAEIEYLQATNIYATDIDATNIDATNIDATTINAITLTNNSNPVPTISLKDLGTDGFQLQVTGVTIEN